MSISKSIMHNIHKLSTGKGCEYVIKNMELLQNTAKAPIKQQNFYSYVN
jgi:hypothetical protein